MHDFLLTSQIRHPHEKNSDVETWLQEKLSVTFSDDTKNDPRQKQLEIIAALQSLEEDEA